MAQSPLRTPPLLGYGKGAPSLLGYGKPAPTWTQAELDAASVERARSSRTSDPITQAWQSSGEGIAAGDLNEAALAAQQAGDTVSARDLLRRAGVAQQRAQVLANDTPGFTQIDSVGSAANWLGGAVGSMGRSAAPAVGAGLVGAGAGALVAGPAGAFGGGLRGFVGGLMRYAPAAAVSYDQLRGENVTQQFADPEVAARPADERARTASLTAAAQTIPEMFLPQRAVTAVTNRIANNPAARRLAREGIDALGEGTTETIQQEMGYQGLQAAGSTAERNPDDYVNAFTAGVAGGAGVSAAANTAGLALDKVLPSATQPGPVPPADPNAPAVPSVEELVTNSAKSVAKTATDFVEDPIMFGARALNRNKVDGVDLKNVKDPEVLAAAIAARDAQGAEDAGMAAQAILDQDRFTAGEKRRILAMNGNYADPANQTAIVATLGFSRLREVGSAFIDQGKQWLDKITGALDKTTKSNLQNFDTSPMVDALAPIFEERAPAAADFFIKMSQAMENPDAKVPPEMEKHLVYIADQMAGNEQYNATFLDALKATGGTALAKRIEYLQNVPGAARDVSTKQNSLFDQLFDDTNTQYTRSKAARLVDKLSLQFGTAAKEQQQEAIDNLAPVFGSPERAKAVLDHYGKLRTSYFKETTDPLPEDDQNTRGIGNVKGTKAAVAAGDLREEDLKGMTAGYRASNPSRPFYAAEDTQALEEAVAAGGPDARAAGMDEYVKLTEQSPAEAYGRIRRDLEKRLRGSRNKDKGWLTAQLEKAVAEGADLKTRQDLEKKIASADDKRSDLPRLEAEWAKLEEAAPGAEDANENRFDKALSLYKVAMRGADDTLASDEDVHRFGRMLRVAANTKPPIEPKKPTDGDPLNEHLYRSSMAVYQEKADAYRKKMDDIKRTEIHFKKTDGSTLKLSAESMIYASPVHGSDLKRLLAAVAMVRARPDIASIENFNVDTLAIREGEKRKAKTIGQLRNVETKRKNKRGQAMVDPTHEQVLDREVDTAFNTMLAGDGREARQAAKRARAIERTKRDAATRKEYLLRQGRQTTSQAVDGWMESTLAGVEGELEAVDAAFKEKPTEALREQREDLRSKKRVLTEFVMEGLDKTHPLPTKNEFTHDLADDTLMEGGFDENRLTEAYLEEVISVLRDRIQAIGENGPQVVIERLWEQLTTRLDELTDLLEEGARRPEQLARHNMKYNPTRFLQNEETFFYVRRMLATAIARAENDRTQIPMVKADLQDKLDKLRAKTNKGRNASVSEAEYIRSYQLALGRLRRVEAKRPGDAPVSYSIGKDGKPRTKPLDPGVTYNNQEEQSTELDLDYDENDNQIMTREDLNGANLYLKAAEGALDNPTGRKKEEVSKFAAERSTQIQLPLIDLQAVADHEKGVTKREAERRAVRGEVPATTPASRELPTGVQGAPTTPAQRREAAKAPATDAPVTAVQAREFADSVRAATEALKDEKAASKSAMTQLNALIDKLAGHQPALPLALKQAPRGGVKTNAPPLASALPKDVESAPTTDVKKAKLYVKLAKRQQAALDKAAQPKEKASEKEQGQGRREEGRREEVLSGQVLTAKLYTREKIRSHPDKIFVFGDNVARSGLGGQAAAARGEPNTIGIPTKYAPTMQASAFFGRDLTKEKAFIDAAFDKIEAALAAGKSVVFPADGVGTGRALLGQKAPELAAHIEARMAKLRGSKSTATTKQNAQTPISDAEYDQKMTDFAEQIAEVDSDLQDAMTARSQATTSKTQWQFGQVVAKLQAKRKQILAAQAAFVVANTLPIPQSYIDELKRVRGPAVTLAFVRGFMQGSGSYTRTTLDGVVSRAINLAATAPIGVLYHEMLHDFFAEIGNTKQLRQLKADLLRAVDRPFVVKQLEQLLAGHPAALQQLKDPEERLAYAYQFWAEGQLRITQDGEGLFKRIAKFLRKTLDILTLDEKLERTLIELHSGRMTTPSDVQTALAKLETLSDRIDRKMPAVHRTFHRIFGAAVDQLHAMNSPSISKLADMFYNNVDQSGFLVKKAEAEGAWRNAYHNIVKKYSPQEIKAALANLQAMKPARGAGLERELRGFFQDIHKYMLGKRVKRRVELPFTGPGTGGYTYEDFAPIRNYFPRIWDPQALVKYKDEFIAMLVKHSNMSQLTAEHTHRDILADSKKRDPAGGGITPFAASTVGRSLKFIDERTSADFAKFQLQDMNEIMDSYIRTSTHRAEYADLFGNSGEVIDDLLSKAANEIAKGPGGRTPELDRARVIVSAMDGTLNDILDPKYKNIMAGVLTLQNWVLLPLAVFSQLIDPLGIAVRTGDIRDAGRAYMRVLTDLERWVKGKVDDVKEKLGRPVTRAVIQDRHRDMAHILGAVQRDASFDSINHAFGSMYMSKGLRNANTLLFRANGMQGINDSFRTAAVVAGERYILEYKDDARRMEELGLKSSDVVEKAPGELDIDSPKMKEAMFRFVDGAIVRPNAAHRAVWMSDPRFMLVTHLKQFAFSFQKVVLERVTHELKNNNSAPLMMLAAYAPVMLAADMAKWVMFGNYPEHWTAMDFFGHAVNRSGLLGKFSFGTDVYGDFTHGNVPGTSFLGPTADHLALLGSWLTGGADASDVIQRSVPLARLAPM